jgi:hypothetical protein
MLLFPLTGTRDKMTETWRFDVYIHHVGKLARVNQKQQIILIHQPNCFKIITEV